jgi:hypothetical protein
VFVDDLVAVAQGVCDQGWRQFLDEAAEGGIPGAAEIDVHGAELAHHRVGVDVLSRLQNAELAELGRPPVPRKVHGL